MTDLGHFKSALPFYASLTLIPVVLLAMYLGGWWLLLVPLYAYHAASLLDVLTPRNTQNEEIDTPDDALFWHRLITGIWLPLQVLLVFGCLYFVVRSDFSTGAMFGLAFGLGIVSGAIGINYAHELMHQSPRWERFMADGLMGMVMYGHFRSEHLLVHHRYVGTPKDPVTARYNEGFHRFFPRVLVACFKSAWGAESDRLVRKGKSPFDLANPFWKYAAWQVSYVILAYLVAGGFGVVLFLFMGFIAIWHLELVNYVEHYGLTRRHLGNGKYEHCQPHHSWNSDHRFTNYMLINLQRHSDHHYKPDRRFPLLQTYDDSEAPQLPYGYAWMTALAMVPPLWKRVMNKRVKAWRARFYPDIEDWHAYNKGLNPLPR